MCSVGSFSPDRAFVSRSADKETVRLSFSSITDSPLMTRAAPARAPILRPGVKGAGRGRGAVRVPWGRRRRRREEVTSRRNI